MTASSTAAPLGAMPRRRDYDDMNDWLNAMVSHRVAVAEAEGTEMPAELAYVAEHGHQVYVNRFKPVVWAALVMIPIGMAMAPSLWWLLASFVFLYFYIDFYSGVLHVVLDNPAFCRLPLLGVPCVEFQWHHIHEYDISSRKLTDVWGDLNVLIIAKAGILFVIGGFTPTTAMIAGVGFFWAYVNQFAHRMSHTAKRRRPGWVKRLHAFGLIVPPEVHQEHHATYDTSFPVLSGKSRHLIQWMLKVFPNQYFWLVLFLALTGADLLVFSYLVDYLITVL